MASSYTTTADVTRAAPRVGCGPKLGTDLWESRFVAASLIPHGWDLQRIRDHSGDQSTEALSTYRVITADLAILSTEPLRAVSAFRFHDLAVVQLAGGDQWYMGSLDQVTGSIHLWATYDDFEDALAGL